METKRLILRRFCMNDADQMLQHWIADPEVQHRYGEPVYRTEFEVQCLLESWMKRYENPAFYRWAILLKKSQELIGQIAFCRIYPLEQAAEVAYGIGRSFWGLGYMTEALKRVSAFALEDVGFLRLEAFHNQDNPASGRVMQKAGMRRTKTLLRFQGEEAPPERICYERAGLDF